MQISNIKLDRNTWWVELLMLNNNTKNYLTECKWALSHLKIKLLFPYKSYIDMNKQDLVLNNPQGLIYHNLTIYKLYKSHCVLNSICTQVS